MSRERGERAGAEFLAWAQGHPREWLLTCDVVRRMAERGACVQRGTVFSWAIAHGVDVSDSAALRRDNNLWPAMSRYLVRYVGAGIRTRRSCVDEAYATPEDLPPLPRELVPAGARRVA